MNVHKTNFYSLFFTAEKNKYTKDEMFTEM